VVAQPARYLVLGRTRGRASVHIIGRYKGDGDVRDVFVTPSIPKSRTLELYVFEIVDPGAVSPEDLVWHIITFDISRTKGGHRPGYEYSYIKDMLLLRWCASIDSSSYVCPSDYSGLLREYLSRVAESYRLESYVVRVFRDKEREMLREAFMETLEYVLGVLESLKNKILELRAKRATQAAKNVAVKADRVARVVEAALSHEDVVVKVSLATRKAVSYWVSQALASLRETVAAQ
jgi:hypothetical protein